MTYVEKMTMKIMGEMLYNYGNHPEVAQVVQQIIADTKTACKKTISRNYTDEHRQTAINEAEVKEREHG